MATIWIKELTGGLDTRRMAATTPGGALIEAWDGHTTRGGEFEKRADFVISYTLPAGTVSLAHTPFGIVVFGHDAAPSGLPAAVTYQRLQHPDGVALARVVSYDLYRGKIYAVGLYEDGSLFHFYDGVRVEDWHDGRARAVFRVVAGGVAPAVPASSTFTITGGTVGAMNRIDDITVNAVSIMSGPVAHLGVNSATAINVASAINNAISSPDYTAIAVGANVTVTAAVAGSAGNGLAVNIVVGGDVTTSGAPAMAGGSDSAVSTLNALTVNGLSIIESAIPWTTSNEVTAAAIVSAISAYASLPRFTAVANGDEVAILAQGAGTWANGLVVSASVSSGFEIDPDSGLTMTGGADLVDKYAPGPFVKTLGSKMYALSGPTLHFSQLQTPTEWNPPATGAGFIDMSEESSGSETLTAVARYQGFIAVFSETNVQIWYVDPDPDNNKWAQTLNNTGTSSPRSVTQFGDNDLFYLNESGLRSLRARDATNSAATTDIGVPVDTLIQTAVAAFGLANRDRIIGAIEPRDGRFWLAIDDEIFVFSFFNGAKVSAWSKYNPGFSVEDMVVFNRRVYLRSGEDIYVYGGLGAAPAYSDAYQAVARIPFLDGGKPTLKKTFRTFDAASEGSWDVEAAFDPNNPDTLDPIGTIVGTTYGAGNNPQEHQSSHISMRFTSRGSGPAKLGSIAITYDGGDDDP